MFVVEGMFTEGIFVLQVQIEGCCVSARYVVYFISQIWSYFLQWLCGTIVAFCLIPVAFIFAATVEICDYSRYLKYTTLTLFMF